MPFKLTNEIKATSLVIYADTYVRGFELTYNNGMTQTFCQTTLLSVTIDLSTILIKDISISSSLWLESMQFCYLNKPSLLTSACSNWAGVLPLFFNTISLNPDKIELTGAYGYCDIYINHFALIFKEF